MLSKWRIEVLGSPMHGRERREQSVWLNHRSRTRFDGVSSEYERQFDARVVTHPLRELVHEVANQVGFLEISLGPEL